MIHHRQSRFDGHNRRMTHHRRSQFDAQGSPTPSWGTSPRSAGVPRLQRSAPWKGRRLGQPLRGALALHKRCISRSGHPLPGVGRTRGLVPRHVGSLGAGALHAPHPQVASHDPSTSLQASHDPSPTIPTRPAQPMRDTSPTIPIRRSGFAQALHPRWRPSPMLEPGGANPSKSGSASSGWNPGLGRVPWPRFWGCEERIGQLGPGSGSCRLKPRYSDDSVAR